MDTSLRDFTFPSGLLYQHSSIILILMLQYYSYLEGVQVDFQKLSGWVSLEEVSDYQDIITRYNLFEEYAFQGTQCITILFIMSILYDKILFPVILMLRTAMEQGMVNCNASMNSVLDETRAHMIDPLDTVFYDPFKNISGRVEVFKNVNRTLFYVNLFMQ